MPGVKTNEEPVPEDFSFLLGGPGAFHGTGYPDRYGPAALGRDFEPAISGSDVSQRGRRGVPNRRRRHSLEISSQRSRNLSCAALHRRRAGKRPGGTQTPGVGAPRPVGRNAFGCEFLGTAEAAGVSPFLNDHTRWTALYFGD